MESDDALLNPFAAAFKPNTTMSQSLLKNPGRTIARFDCILSAWQSTAPDDHLSDMSLEDFEASVEESRAIRNKIALLDAELRALIVARTKADAKNNTLTQGVIFAVRGDPKHGANSPLYAAMGFIPESQKSRGTQRKRRAETPPAQEANPSA